MSSQDNFKIVYSEEKREGNNVLNIKISTFNSQHKENLSIYKNEKSEEDPKFLKFKLNDLNH